MRRGCRLKEKKLVKEFLHVTAGSTMGVGMCWTGTVF